MIDFKTFLEQRLQQSLPGRPAQRRMAPNPLNGANSLRNYEPEHDDYRNSSVLVPILKQQEEWKIIFTLRTQSINHGGQISFPGGGREGHETMVETALREAQEEIGLIPDKVQVAGTLTPLYVGHSDNMVTPVVGFIEEQEEFTPNPNEVDEIFKVELQLLAGDRHLTDEEWDLRGVAYQVPFWDIHRVPLWGATAMMLNELIELYQEFTQSEI